MFHDHPNLSPILVLRPHTVQTKHCPQSFRLYALKASKKGSVADVCVDCKTLRPGQCVSNMQGQLSLLTVFLARVVGVSCAKPGRVGQRNPEDWNQWLDQTPKVKAT